MKRGGGGCAVEVEEKEVSRRAQRTDSRSHSSSLLVSDVPRRGGAVEAGPDQVEKIRRVEQAPRLSLKRSALKGPDEGGDSLALSQGAQEQKGLR